MADLPAHALVSAAHVAKASSIAEKIWPIVAICGSKIGPAIRQAFRSKWFFHYYFAGPIEIIVGAHAAKCSPGNRTYAALMIRKWPNRVTSLKRALLRYFE
jgi:hypothetical protein